jgi:prefoldin subunit 5
MLQWLNDYGSFIGTSVIIAGAIGWFIKIQMKDVKKDICDLKKDVAEVSAETKTNGGKSIKDQINRLDERTNEADQMRRDMDKKLDKMYGILIDYISKSNK